jgi:hypothetical protein
MSIKGNVGNSVTTIGAGDQVVYEQPVTVERYAITAFNIFNNSASAVTVNLFSSPDLTSASGEKVAQYSIPANSDIDINALIGQGYMGFNIIATASTGGVLNASITLTAYDGGD